jgi:hypothetical protein
MNLVAHGEGRYYVVSVRKEDGKFFVKTVIVSDKEEILLSVRTQVDSEAEAKEKCRSLVRIKTRKRGYVKVELEKVPDFIAGFLAAELDKQFTPQEILEYVKKVRRERYVILMDNTGLEDCFDLGVEYLAYDSGDPDTIDVCDKFGALRGVYHERIASVEKTENAILIEKKF